MPGYTRCRRSSWRTMVCGALPETSPSSSAATERGSAGGAAVARGAVGSHDDERGGGRGDEPTDQENPPPGGGGFCFWEGGREGAGAYEGGCWGLEGEL